MDLTRRSALQAGAAASVAALTPMAGCVDDDPADAYAVLFALADLADGIASDRLDVANPVPVGAHGHGWSPEGGLQTEIAAADLFVYLDHPQWSWAQDVVENLEAEDVDVHTVDALAGIDLLEWDAEHGGDHDGADDGHDDHDGSDHDRGRYDPHVWLDPVRAQTAVETIADALVEVDPDGEATFDDAAQRYTDDLVALDESFETAVEQAEHDSVVLASHDSFQYVSDRYGVAFETPTGVSPDEQASQADLVELIEFVDERGIEYVCYDEFEGDRQAQLIVEDSTAEAALPLTPLAGTTDDWRDEHGGYVDQFREINLANIRRAMGSV